MNVTDLREGFFASPLMRELDAIARADGPYPESEAKRHHFVPKFFLRRWVGNPDERERIFQLDVKSGRPQSVDPEKAASRTRFYRATDDDGTVHQRVEYFLGRVETHAAKALRRLVESPSIFSPADRATFSLFISLQESRTIGGLERIEALADTTMKTLMASRTVDRVQFAEDYAAAIGPDHDPETVEQMREEILSALAEDRVKLANPREIALGLMLGHVADGAQYVYQMEWWLLQAPKGSAFVTSDRAIAMHDPRPPYPWSGHAMLSSPVAQTTIPLDPTHCLLLRPPRSETSANGIRPHAVDAERVTEINLRMYGFASEYVFAHDQKTATDLRREAKRRPKDVIRPRSTPQVMLIDAEAGDDRLALEHRSKGWPARIPIDGVPHDYVVLDGDRTVEKSVDLSELGRERAIRRLGSADVRESTVSIDPRDLF